MQTFVDKHSLPRHCEERSDEAIQRGLSSPSSLRAEGEAIQPCVPGLLLARGRNDGSCVLEDLCELIAAQVVPESLDSSCLYVGLEHFSSGRMRRLIGDVPQYPAVRHCEERSSVAIQRSSTGLLRFARNDDIWMENAQ
jgi:hypothetical protein